VSFRQDRPELVFSGYLGRMAAQRFTFWLAGRIFLVNAILLTIFTD
jgi:preprotein translocase subunit SecG